MMWMVRGVRGATTVKEDSLKLSLIPGAVTGRSRPMASRKITSPYHLSTQDLTTAYHDGGAHGWQHTPAGCVEMNKPGGGTLHTHPDSLEYREAPGRINHVYLNGVEPAPDLSANGL
jgi:chorismate mutase